MGFLLGLLIFIFVIISILSFVIRFVDDELFDKNKSLINKGGIASLILSIILIILNSSLVYNNAGEQLLIVSPRGGLSSISTEGYKLINPLSKVTMWQKFVVVDSKDEIGSIPIRFIDQVTANANVSVRFQLPTDEPTFCKMAVEYRTQDNLVNNTLIPTVREQMINTGYMFAAQDYISGSAQSFRQTFEDQLKDGAYKVQKIEKKDSIFNNDVSRSIKKIETSYTVEKVFEGGIPARVPHEITKNNIVVSQVIVEQLELEAVFKKRLESQRDESAKRQLEQQKIKTAKDAQARIIAEGERDKAAERVSQEKEQVKALIAIETKLKQEETNRSLAEIALKTERLKAEAEKVKADAESYKNKKLVIAGLTPQQKADLEKEKAIGVARELAKIKFPNTMIIGGDSKNGTPLESLIGAAMAKQLTGN